MRARIATMENKFEILNDLDLVWGAKNIAALIGCNTREAYWRLETKGVPAKKVGKLWVASREELRQFFSNSAAA